MSQSAVCAPTGGEVVSCRGEESRPSADHLAFTSHQQPLYVSPRMPGRFLSHLYCRPPHKAHNVAVLYVFGEEQTRDQRYDMQEEFCFTPIKTLVHRDTDIYPPHSCREEAEGRGGTDAGS